MKLPAIRGIIDRRILVNFRIDPDVMARNLPAPFRPKLAHGYAIGGICLIRMKAARPTFSPLPWGFQSENAAHRIAVEWAVDGQVRQGVYVPRRDTNSALNRFAGGTLFPGLQHRASFTVEELTEQFRVTMHSEDGAAHVHVDGALATALPQTSVFASLDEASQFFEQGSLGYSDTHADGLYDGLELRCKTWHVDPLAIEEVKSSYFEDADRFPNGSVAFDNALLIRDIDHEWHGRDELCCPLDGKAGGDPRTHAQADFPSA